MDKLLQPNIPRAPQFSLSSRSYIQPLDALPSALDYQRVSSWRPTSGFKMPRNYTGIKSVVEKQINHQVKPRVKIEITPGPDNYFVDLYGPKLKLSNISKQGSYGKDFYQKKTFNKNGFSDEIKPKDKIFVSKTGVNNTDIGYYENWATGKDWLQKITSMRKK